MEESDSLREGGGVILFRFKTSSFIFFLLCLSFFHFSFNHIVFVVYIFVNFALVALFSIAIRYVVFYIFF